MTELITYIFELITTIISFFASILLIRQKKSSQVPLGNLFLSLSTSLMGIYALSTIIYSLIGQEWVIIVFLKLGMVSITMAVLLLYFTMQVLIYSSKWIRTHKIWFWVPLAISIIISSLLIFTDFIEVRNAKTAETHFNPLVFYPFVIFVAFMLIYSTFSLYHFGIRNIEGPSKKHMQLFFIGLICIIISLVIDALGNIIEYEVLFDTLLFGTLSLGIFFIAGAFLRKEV